MSGSISFLLTISNEVCIAIRNMTYPSQKSQFRDIPPRNTCSRSDSIGNRRWLWDLNSGLLVGIDMRNNICEGNNAGKRDKFIWGAVVTEDSPIIQGAEYFSWGKRAMAGFSCWCKTIITCGLSPGTANYLEWGIFLHLRKIPEESLWYEQIYIQKLGELAALVTGDIPCVQSSTP